MKNTVISTILAFIILVSFSSCGKQPQENSKNDIEQQLRDSANADIVSITICDFDLDGQEEAFALMGEKELISRFSNIFSQDIYNAELWFCGKDGAQKLSDNNFRSDDGIFEVGKQSFYVSSRYSETQVVSDIYYVKDGSVVETDISGKGGNFTVNDSGDVSLIFVDHDLVYTNGMLAGRTEKTYYFRWNGGTKHFEECGGYILPQRDFLDLKGAAELLERLKKEHYIVEEILYYGGGAALNFYTEDENRYHMRVAVNYGTIICPEEDIEVLKHEGYLKSAAIPEIADYPETGKIPRLFQNEHFKIYSGSTQEDHFFFYYDIFDLSGEVIKHVCTYRSQPEITEVGKHILKISVQAGTSRLTRNTYYYDTEKNVFSPVYCYVLCETEELTAYFQINKIIVRGIFDDEYYEEIELEKELSVSTEPILNAAFFDNSSSITVTYFSGDNYDRITETVDIPAK